MPFSPGGIRIDPANQTAVVSFTILNGGGTPIAYSSIGGTGTLALPATITTPTTFYFAEQTQFVVSALVGGVQAASPSGGTVAVDLSSEGTAALTLSVPGSVALTKSAADATYSAKARKRVVVADSLYTVAGPFSQSAVGTFRAPHSINVDCSELVLTYVNAYNTEASNFLDTDNTVAMVIRCALEIGGVIYPLTFGGARTATIDGGGMAKTDPLGVEVTSGQIVYVRTYVSSTGWYRPRGSYQAAGSGGFTATTDLTAAGSAAISDAGSVNLLDCNSLTGLPKALSTAGVLIVGDSIARGQGDGSYGGGRNTVAPATQGDGFISRALYGKAGALMVAIPSEKASGIVSLATRFRRYALIAETTHAICEYGTNDAEVGGASVSILQNALLAFWKILAQRGLKVYQTTLLPQSTSTDNFATAGNQTSKATNSIRQGFNDWVRAGAPLDATALTPVAVGTAGALLAGATTHPLTSYFEVADTVETARNSGIWKTNGTANFYTVDGVHPTSAGHALMAAGIDTTKF